MNKIRLLNNEEIRNNIGKFENGLKENNDDGRESWARYSSFDYCYNYFQDFSDKRDISAKQNIQNSCLHLAFYLASWGMLRGSSFLLQKSIKFYEHLIEYFSNLDKSYWIIDLPYSDQDIDKLLDCSNMIREILGENGKNKVSDTLVTKIMLGVFGNVPAFDSYFKNGSNLGILNRNALVSVNEFYNINNVVITNEARKIMTYDYSTGKASKRTYSKAKIVDMIYFIEGFRQSKK